MYSLDRGGVKRFLLDTANTRSIYDSDAHVALFAPGGAPRVLHDPVLLVTVGTPSNNESGVVKLSSALRLVKDSRRVHLEISVIGLNRDRKGTLLECSLHLRSAFTLNVLVASVLDFGLGFGLVLAGSVPSGVLVVGLKLSKLGLIELESLVLPSTVATVVRSGAVNEFLLGESEENSR